MSNILLSLMILIMSFNLFTISYQVNGINRVVIHTPIAYFEVSIPLANSDELYFDKVKLEERLMNYYSKSIEKYTHKYNVNFYYYNLEDESVCLGDKCRGVEITVDAGLMFYYSYTRTMFYQIEER